MKKHKVPGGNELINPEKILKEELGLTYGSSVGDFGCGGAGYFVLQSAMIVGPEGQVYAVDIQKTVLSNIETRAKLYNFRNIKTVWSDLEKYRATQIADSSLDFGLAINILFQNSSPELIMKECSRMIKKHGKILVVDWKDGNFPLGPKPGERFRLEDMRLLAQKLDLREIKSFEAGPFHYGVIFERQ